MSVDTGGGAVVPGGEAGELPGGGAQFGLGGGSASSAAGGDASSSKFRVNFSDMQRPSSSRDGGGGGGAGAADGPSPAERKWYMKRPGELIAEQMGRGFDEPAASRRVIQQLQGMLAVQSVRHPARLRKIEEEASKSRLKIEEVDKKVDRLADKLDGKPDFAAVALTGFTSGAFAVLLGRGPEIWRSLMDMQQSVSAVTSRKAG